MLEMSAHARDPNSRTPTYTHTYIPTYIVRPDMSSWGCPCSFCRPQRCRDYARGGWQAGPWCGSQGLHQAIQAPHRGPHQGPHQWFQAPHQWVYASPGAHPQPPRIENGLGWFAGSSTMRLQRPGIGCAMHTSASSAHLCTQEGLARRHLDGGEGLEVEKWIPRRWCRRPWSLRNLTGGTSNNCQPT